MRFIAILRLVAAEASRYRMLSVIIPIAVWRQIAGTTEPGSFKGKVIVQSWLPALDGVEAKLKSGAKVADVGCGVGYSTLLMAQAFPKVSLSGTISTRLPSKRRTDMPSHMGWVIA